MHCFDIEIKELYSGYYGRHVLKNISVKIPRSSLISLIGPNGSGKTTFLRVLAGLQRYSGSVKLCGREIGLIKRKSFAQSVSVMLSQKNYAPAYSFSALDVISMGRLPFKNLFSRMNSYDRGVIIDAAKKTGVEEFLSRSIVSLSDGERQLVMLACTLAQNCGIMLLDEPTSALDPDRAARVFEMLHRLALQEGRTLVVAVHDINTSLGCSDFYMALKNGELLSLGRAEELNSEVLKNLYGSNFTAYKDPKNLNRSDVMWRVMPE